MSIATKTIDLAGANTTEAVLTVLGKELCLGGPDGNHTVIAANAGDGWGMNWDALQDSMLYLDSGGIWGNSPKFAFPLLLELVNCSSFREADPQSFQILKDVLSTTKERYAEDGIQFDYLLR
jgi:hypothetical protein